MRVSSLVFFPLKTARRVLVTGVGLAAAAWMLWGFLVITPYAQQTALDQLTFSLVIQDKSGNPLQVLPLKAGLRRVFRPLKQMPSSLVRIVLTAEDRGFWWHPGVDPLALLRAVWQNAAHRETVSGASTLAMQLARLLHPHAHNLAGKAAEAWEALQLSARLGRAGVLELYLNLVPFGSNLEGFPAAARAFYGKDVLELTPNEAAELAIVPRSPQTYSPWVFGTRSLTRARELVKSAFPDGAYDGKAPRVLDPARSDLWPFRTPQYVQWLTSLPEVARLNGREPLRTGIDPALQSYLETLIFRTVDSARPKRISNAAGFFLEPKTMTIEAWVGSANFFNVADEGQNDGVTIARQPGSTLKPFLYAMALEQGFTASTILPDVPTDFGGEEVYTPANFNDQFNGPVRLRQALSSSLNVPAVYTLQRIGVRPFADFLISAGFTTLESQRHELGLGLALGNAEVRLFDLVQAYGLFLHEGSWTPVLPFPGFKLPALSKDRVRLIDPKVAELVRNILTRHPDRTLAYGSHGNDKIPLEGAMKTGTSNQFNNIWAIGFTPELLGGVWMGNFSGNTIVGAADSGYPASIVSKTLEAFGSNESFLPLRDLERHRICAVSGLEATDNCPDTIDEWFIPGTAPGPCTWHGPAGEVHYPQEFQTWLEKYRYRRGSGYLASRLAILRPRQGAVFYDDPSAPRSAQQLALEAIGPGQAEVRVDDRLIMTLPFPLRTWIPLTPGEHRLSVRESVNGNETSVEFVVH